MWLTALLSSALAVIANNLSTRLIMGNQMGAMR
jgi:hypothetical protein